MKQYKWKLRDGREVVLEARYSEEIIPEEAYLDGYTVVTGKKVFEDSSLVAYIDGKYFDHCRAPWTIVDTEYKGVKKIHGIKQIGFTEERALEIEKFLHDVVEEGRNEEVAAFLAEEEAKKMAEKVKRAKELIKKAEEQKDIPTRREAERQMHVYRAMNDGGDGYVPYIISLEEYEEAKAFVNAAEATT